MKKSFSFLFVLVFPVALLIMAYNTGSPGGKTGSPGDSGNTCTDCHSGTATAIDSWIVSNIPPEGYTPGAVYNITAIGTHTGVVLFGFELTAEDDQGNKIGTLTVTDPLQTQHTNSNAAITHTAEGNTPIGNMKTWNMGWTAPMTAVGEITFYAAFNAADGNGNTSGDVIYTSTLTVDNTAPATLISITPNSAIQNETLVTTIIGDHTSFSSSSTATLAFSDDPGETVEGTDIEAVSTEELNATFSIPVDASTGMWDLLVDGVTLEDAFEVIAAPPSIVLISPNVGNQGSEFIDARINGLNTSWTSGVTDVYLAYNANPDETIIGTNIDVISDTYLEFDFAIPLDASIGLWDVHVDDLVFVKGFTMYTPVAIAENDIFANINVYPNPSKGFINIEGVEDMQVHIYNAVGEKVYSIEQATGKQRIDLTGLTKGVYFVNFRQDDQQKMKKIILTK